MSLIEKPKESALKKIEKIAVPLMFCVSVYAIYAVLAFNFYSISFFQRVFFLSSLIVVLAIVSIELVEEKFQKQEKQTLTLGVSKFPLEESKWKFDVPTKVDFGDICFLSLALAGIPIAFYAGTIGQGFDFWGWLWTVIYAVSAFVVYISRPKSIRHTFNTNFDSFEIREWNVTRKLESREIRKVEITAKTFLEDATSKVNIKFYLEEGAQFGVEFKGISKDSKEDLLAQLKQNFTELQVSD